MTEPLKIGVVGVGAVSLRGLVPHLVQEDIADRVNLTALCDPVVERVEATAHKYGVPRAFTSLDELLARGDVDAVTIATPIGLHYEQGKQAILAGKHVHFNKTMTLTAAEATELIGLANDKGVRIVASPGEMQRPHHRAVRKLIADGAIGTVAWAATGAAFGNYHEGEKERDEAPGGTPVDPSWYFRKPGGGPLYDMSVYALHSLTGILGPAKRVTALSGVRVSEREFGNTTIPTEMDDNTFMLLDFGGSLFALVYGAAAGQVPGSSLFGGTFFGTRGMINGLLLNGEPFEYEGRDVAMTARDKGKNHGGSGGNQWILPHVTGAHRNIGEQHVFSDIMQLVDWVRDGKPPVATAEHARHVIEIIESAYRSAETGQAEALKTVFTQAI
jgi:predicted dehydrogenase